MLVKAKQNAKKQNLKLNIMHSDWRRMRQISLNQYDAVICLGNSISHLFLEEQIQSLSALYRCLKPNGILVVDHLNYDRIFQIGDFDRWFQKNMHVWRFQTGKRCKRKRVLHLCSGETFIGEFYQATHDVVLWNYRITLDTVCVATLLRASKNSGHLSSM